MPEDVVISSPMNRKVTYTNDGAELPTFYINNAEFMVSTWDMRMRLGQVDGATDDVLAIRNTVTVYMSLEHAKVFVEKAAEALAKWEAFNANQKKG
jgi:hypothetical protein